jgi:hypothetical protein
MREHGWQVGPACGYGDMILAYRPNYSHVLREGVRLRLREDRNLLTAIQPKQSLAGCTCCGQAAGA